MDIFQKILMDLPQIGENKMTDNKSRMIELKRKNTISNISKEWKKASINIEINDFLSVQETLHLQDDIMRKLEEMDVNHTYIISQNDDFITEFTQILLSKIDEGKKYVFFLGEANETGALMLKGDIILKEYSYIIKKSELYNVGCCIFFYCIDIESGICFWKGEYDNRIYIW